MQPYTYEQFAATRRITGFEPAADGDTVYYIADTSGQFNLWQVPTTGGVPEQLTFFTEQSVRDLVVNADKIAFVADAAGNEKLQVYLLPTSGGQPVRVTDLPKVQHTLGAFSPDGRYLAYSANAAGPQDVDVYLRDMTAGETRRLTPGGKLMYTASFSPDGAYILAVQPISNTDQNLWLINVATGEARNLTEHDGRQAIYLPTSWSRNDFWFFSNEGREFLAVGCYDLEADRKQYVVTADWDVERFAVSETHRLMAYCINESGNSHLHVTDLRTGQELTLPNLPKGVVNNLRIAEDDQRRRLFLSMTCYNHAAAIYVVDLDEQSLSLLTPSMVEHLPGEAFSAPELVHIEAYDGRQIPAWLYRPNGASPGEKVPAVLSIHGGPETQERTDYRYNGFYQCLLSQGIAVLAPNIRGSTGFGIGWQKQVHRDWGGGDLKDMEACARYLQSLAWVDGGKLAVWGRSYGGFASLSCATRLPRYWACAVDFCGPANLVTFARSVPPYWKPMIKAWIGDPDEDRDLLIERSPITYVEQIRCPLMVVQGAMDPRVVKAESDQMVERLRELGREVEYLVFEDEGHDFTKQSNQLAGYEAMVAFLVKHLKHI